LDGSLEGRYASMEASTDKGFSREEASKTLRVMLER